MKRTPEPEIMDAADRARAYADADFAEVNAAFVDAVTVQLDIGHTQRILDVGCGPGDITAALAARVPNAVTIGVDASPAMLRIAGENIAWNRARCRFISADALRLPFATGTFDAVVSNSILHHVRDVEAFWREVLRVAAPGALLFQRDLSRPRRAADARALVDEHAADEHPFLREDFYNSLLAAYSPEEVREQLAGVGIANAHVAAITDRHLEVVFRR